MYNICCPCVIYKSQSIFFNSFVYITLVGSVTTNVTGKTEKSQKLGSVFFIECHIVTKHQKC